ncbi:MULTISPECIES: helix-turn-helix domain-containing protein [Cysteiniphilum]|uniref:helix-turn-helix domain-containing protein n=1 Tax=Cysteiniphilum TaxID=2056696 RepID=UPI001783F5AD|nr:MULTISPECIES: helix-turn-helix domain-containing protein [Cysteiniphilum]
MTYNQPVKDTLLHFKELGYSYDDVVKLTGFVESTVRKWCRYYKVYLSHYVPDCDKQLEYQNILNAVRSKKISYQNVLYKKW